MQVTSIRLLTLLCAATCWVWTAHAEQVPSPSDLQAPCRLTNIVMILDDFSSFHMNLVDRRGRTLRFSYSGNRVYFNGKTKSVPGSPEEQTLLGIIEKAFSNMHDPVLEQNPAFPYVPGREWECFNIRTTEYAIKVLTRRCLTKAELKYGEVK